MTHSYKVKRHLFVETETVVKRAMILSGNMFGNQNWVMGNINTQGEYHGNALEAASRRWSSCDGLKLGTGRSSDD